MRVKTLIAVVILFMILCMGLLFSSPRDREITGMEREHVLMEIKEMSPVSIHLGINNATGYMKNGKTLGPLPVGSTFDRERGIFSWLPGPGFVGKYRFLFISMNGKEKSLTVHIKPSFTSDRLPVEAFSLKISHVHNQGDKPFGAFDTPLDGATVMSSIAVTGWALDNKGVENVKIYRMSGNTPVFIGDAVFIEGARPDVAQAYPGYPNNTAAGWGYMMLTNFLPNGGNGTFTIVAKAADSDGNTVTLGSKTIFCDNANAIKPFGAIDDPKQGGTISGSGFRNQGWVLTPPPNKIPEDGSTISVIIDGVVIGTANYNVYRSDIATLFPGYANSNAALAYFDFDTTAYANGLHTIAWQAVDSGGNTDGIGSRYFSVSNGATPLSGDYYVSVTGSDSNDGSSRDTAFKTIRKAFRMAQPGQTILLLNGTYNESIELENIGGSGGVITLQGESSEVILDGQRSLALGIWCENCQNITFDTMVIRYYTDIGIGATYSSGITLRNLAVHGNGFAVQLKSWELEGYGIDIDICSDVLVESNETYNNGPNPQVPSNLMGTGINTFGCTDCIIRNNTSYENTGGGMLVEDGVNVLVEGNLVYNNDCDASVEEWWDAGLWVDGGHNITVRNNTFTGNLGAGIEISDEDFQSPYGYVLENNVCTGNYFGIFIWNFGTTGWPATDIISRSGNTFSGNTRKDIWIEDWYEED